MDFVYDNEAARQSGGAQMRVLHLQGGEHCLIDCPDSYRSRQIALGAFRRPASLASWSALSRQQALICAAATSELVADQPFFSYLLCQTLVTNGNY